MKLALKLATVALLFTPGLRANEIEAPPKPVAQRPFRPKIYLGELGLLAGSRTLDGISTRNALNQGAPERNWLYGAHPSIARQSSTQAAFFALDAGALLLTEHSHHRAIRWLGRAFMAGETARETQLGLMNLHNATLWRRYVKGGHK
jgi:hypothetical protein